ncbi:MAG: GTP-binding protein [Candidatus Helarchaeota archaeon]|nr:GTP-binding protein [Candidatus Helarchaeota archaeon]
MDYKRYTFKLVLVGDFAVGKTSLIHEYMEKKFQYDYKPTIGANIAKKVFTMPKSKVVASVNFWDIAGQKMFATLHRPFFEGANGVLIVYDVTRSDSFNNLSNWFSDFKKIVKSDIPGVIVGNKIDLERKVSTKEGKNYAESIGFYFIETSAKENKNVEDAFRHILSKILPK